MGEVTNIGDERGTTGRGPGRIRRTLSNIFGGRFGRGEGNRRTLATARRLRNQ